MQCSLEDEFRDMEAESQAFEIAITARKPLPASSATRPVFCDLRRRGQTFKDGKHRAVD